MRMREDTPDKQEIRDMGSLGLLMLTAPLGMDVENDVVDIIVDDPEWAISAVQEEFEYPLHVRSEGEIKEVNSIHESLERGKIPEAVKKSR